MQTGQRIGTSIGIAVITAVVFFLLNYYSWAVAITAGFALITAILMLSLLIAYKDLGRRRDVNLAKDNEPVPNYPFDNRSEEHTSELQSRPHLVCRLLLEKKKSSLEERM